MATADEFYGKDIAFKSDFIRASSGDLDTITGLANLKEAIIRRIITQPGSLVFRPNYGVGLKSYLNGEHSVSLHQRLAAKIKEQIEQDPRVEAVLGLRIVQSDSVDGLVTIYVRIKPVGYAELAFSFNEAS